MKKNSFLNLGKNILFANRSQLNAIEGINIEYGKIENCKIDTILASKISRRLTSNTNDVNIEFSIENGKIETVTSKLASTYLTSTVKTGSNGVPVGWGWGGPPADDDRGCYDPV